MSAQDFAALGLLSLLVWFVYWLGREIGKHQQQDLWRDHMEKCDRYARAVDDLDKWCSHQSPHARLIARHLHATGEGLSLNAGTPSGDEACQIGGLREQLKRLDAARKQADKPPAKEPSP
ncbi:MAG: hypothetical protein WAP57_11810 [Aquabacterium commune]|uniref:hypothetical protein n=1 Tax=Aquabacterium commune TaxID=70586 RepID=UPI003BB00A53